MSDIHIWNRGLLFGFFLIFLYIMVKMPPERIKSNFTTCEYFASY